jgi:hypothetical protein
MNDLESAAMWGLYLKTDEGIAIRSTLGRLRDCLKQAPQTVHIGTVQYINYDTKWMRDSDTLSPFLHKRRSFEHERELRAVVQTYPIKGGKIDFDVEQSGLGLNVPVDLNVLVAGVYVSPRAQHWFHDLVTSVMAKYQLSVTPVQSQLADAALY